MIGGLVDGSIPDYQLSAWAMAILCRGMNATETACLTDAMLESGQRLVRVSERPRVDKHSTGGLGDKVSLVLAPLLACFEVDVPMLSGRGLGITGGTLDKLESYQGFNCDLTRSQIDDQLRNIGCVITGTTPDIAPADRKLYSLRDVTGTVPSIALITSSIMSKKLSESLDALILDVKFGSGAFMRDMETARRLADSLCATGARMGVTTRAILSDMNQPLGRMVGNACEANESVQLLQNLGPDDLKELTLRLAAELLVAVGRWDSLDVATGELQAALADGRGFLRYQQMIAMQGGKFVEQLPLASASILESPFDGWIGSMDGQLIGQAVVGLGGGRQQLHDQVDHTVGLEMLVRIGQRVERSQPIVRIFSRHPSAVEEAKRTLLQAISVIDQPTPAPRLIYE